MNGPESRCHFSLCSGMELHHPIMSKLWDPRGRTQRKKKKESWILRLYGSTIYTYTNNSSYYTSPCQLGLRFYGNTCYVNHKTLSRQFLNYSHINDTQILWHVHILNALSHHNRNPSFYNCEMYLYAHFPVPDLHLLHVCCGSSFMTHNNYI